MAKNITKLQTIREKSREDALRCLDQAREKVLAGEIDQVAIAGFARTEGSWSIISQGENFQSMVGTITLMLHRFMVETPAELE